VDRDDRSPIVATFFTETPIVAGSTVALSESAAHHARVKRLDVGDGIRLTDGRGTLGEGELTAVGKNGAEVRVDATQSVARPTPIHLRVPIGDRDRMLMLAEKATELAVASWQGVRFRRSMSVSPRGEGSAFADKVRARMVSALEQSGGAWLPRILTDVAPEAVSIPANATRILLDVHGEALLRVSGGGESVVMFGPEGGIEEAERDALVAAGWRPATLASTILRFETAGIAAIAVIRGGQLFKEP